MKICYFVNFEKLDIAVQAWVRLAPESWFQEDLRRMTHQMNTYIKLKRNYTSNFITKNL